MNFLKRTQVLFTVFTALVSTGCSTVTDEDKIGDAQYCLDDIPLTGLTTEQRTVAVNTCLGKLGSVAGPKASLIRCSANFIIEGFADPSRLVNAMNNISSSNGNNGTVAMMSVLAFTSQADADANASFAQQTLSICQQAGNPGFVLVASFSNIASALVKASAAAGNILSDGVITPQELNDVISNAGNLPAEVIGATATAAYQASCSSGTESNEALCSELGQALNSQQSNEAIGQALLDSWKNNQP